MTKLNYKTLTLPDGDKRYRSIEINSSGDLVFEQTDIGTNTARLAPNGGDSDYEAWVTVDANCVSDVLLKLVRDKFSDQDEFSSWLKQRDIPYDFYSC